MAKAKADLKYFNPNPKNLDVADCVVRALCKATGESWVDMYTQLFELGLEVCDMPNGNTTWKEYVARHESFIERKLQIRKGVKRPTVRTFCKAHPKGTYLLSLANHLVTVQDGCYYDIWDCGEKSVYKYWEVE